MSIPGGSGRPTWLRDLTVLALVAGLWFCALLGLRPLSNPDEGRYTEIPREMAASGDFVTPRLDGVKYFEKPPLVYWLSALTFRQFGVNEFTARLWGGLFSLAGVLLTYSTTRVLYGRAAGIWAAIVLATTLFYYVMSQIILLDMAVAVTISGALFTFILAMQEPRGRRRLGLFLAFYAFMGLATLSKGLIGIALPGAVIFLWVLLLNRWRALWPFYPLLGTVLLLAVAAPWHVYAARANADFLNFYFVHEHWLRFTTRIHGRFKPWWFFLPILLVGLFPWVFFARQVLRDALAGGWAARKQNAESWFFLIWVVFIVAFFSKSQSKLVPYILPVFPALAVLFGRTLAGVWQGRRANPLRGGAWAYIATCLLLLLAFFVAPRFFGEDLKDQPELAAYLPVLQLTLGGTLLLGAAAAALGLRRNHPRLILGAMALAGAGLLVALNLGGSSFEKTSTKKIALILKPRLKPEDRVYCLGYYAQDLPVYLNRLVSLVDNRGELDFGIAAEPALTATRFVVGAEFPSHWARPGTAYAVVRKNSYAAWFASHHLPHRVLADTGHFVLVVNHPAPTPP
ncbi:MAG: phospholipid carrier-dependent glycosyltransferase [Verrucomicrobiota bacterium]